MVTITANRYPSRVLQNAGDALVVFAAAFHGAQDAAFMAEAELLTTCLDQDGEKIAEMAGTYPADWEWVVADAFDLKAYPRGRTWDVVSLDPPTNLFNRCADWVPFWCDLARDAVVLGTGIGTEVDPPAGWRVTEVMPRSNFQGGVYWTVLEPC